MVWCPLLTAGVSNLKLVAEIQEEIRLNVDAPRKSLYEAIEENTEEIVVEPTTKYDFAGVYGFGKGIFKRDALEGSNTSYKIFHKLHENDLVISKVKGWEGAIALVTHEFDGLFLSPQYPSFKAKEGVNIRYMRYIQILVMGVRKAYPIEKH